MALQNIEYHYSAYFDKYIDNQKMLQVIFEERTTFKAIIEFTLKRVQAQFHELILFPIGQLAC